MGEQGEWLEKEHSNWMENQVRRLTVTGADRLYMPGYGGTGRASQEGDDTGDPTATEKAMGDGAVKKPKDAKLLGTMKGVFVPTAQNILGVIIFLRLPWIIGQSGILHATFIVALACTVGFVTSLSLSAVTTNGKVLGGGAYNIIKKSLGPQFGATVGLLLFCSNTFGCAMYVLGAVEAIQDWNPDITIDKDQDTRILGTIVLASLASIVFVGISYISKFAMAFLTGVLLGFASIYAGVGARTITPVPEDGLIGLTWENYKENYGPEYTGDHSFAKMLALFFPAITDPLAGSNLSGDLLTPQESIPKGTLSAVFICSVMFILQIQLVGGMSTRQALIDDKLIVTRIAWPTKEIVYLAILLSTLGAGLQSLAGAPRLMNGLAQDRLIPQLNWLAAKPGQEPRKALLLCWLIAQGATLMGSLDIVAPFITMFFLTCYAIINLACFILAFEHSPSFRPTFKYFHWTQGLLGTLICLGVMFFINWYFALAAIVVMLLIYKYVGLRGAIDPAMSGWTGGLRFQDARRALLALEDGDFQHKHWRPFIMYICRFDKDGNLDTEHGIDNLLCQIMLRGKGLVMLGGVVEGTYVQRWSVLEKANAQLRKRITAAGIDGFADVICASSKSEGHSFLVHGKGLNALRPNTVMLGWPDSWTPADSSNMDGVHFVELLEGIFLAGKSAMVVKGNADKPFPDPSSDPLPKTCFVDVWLVLDDGGLPILFSHLLKAHKIWRSCQLRIFQVARKKDNPEHLGELLRRLVTASGINATVGIKTLPETGAPPIPVAAIKPVSIPGTIEENDGVETVSIDEGRTINSDLSSAAKKAALDKSRELNKLFVAESANSELVVTNLPPINKKLGPNEYMTLVDTMCQGLQRVVMVREGNANKIELYS